MSDDNTEDWYDELNENQKKQIEYSWGTSALLGVTTGSLISLITHYSPYFVETMSIMAGLTGLGTALSFKMVAAYGDEE